MALITSILGSQPLFVIFALPSWWHGFWMNTTSALLPLLLCILRAAGIFEAIRTTFSRAVRHPELKLPLVVSYELVS